MNLVIDSGNSSAKIGIFDQHRLVKKSSFDSEEGLKVFVEQNFFEHVLISSVKGEAGRIGSWIKPEAKVYVLDRSLSLPVKNGYRTPETLGMDRLAAVCGAQHLYPGHDCLVIDAGPASPTSLLMPEELITVEAFHPVWQCGLRRFIISLRNCR